VVGQGGAARANSQSVPAVARSETIDTEHQFGFTIGSDVGEFGKKEIEGSITARFSKRTGTYAAATCTLSAEFVPVPNLRTEVTGVVRLDRCRMERTGRGPR